MIALIQKTALFIEIKDTLTRLTFIRPDDWHTHFREGTLMQVVTPYTAKVFARAIAMPNLNSPVTTVKQCLIYQKQLKDCTHHFEPLMSLYLTDDTTPEMIIEAKPDVNHYAAVFGVKLYPTDTTTNAQYGVTNPLALMSVFETMATQQLPLLVHGEINDASVDIYDREHIFIERVLAPLRKYVPSLKIVFEHITTKTAIDFVLADNNTAATITPHHLYYNRNDLFVDGLRPQRYCLPLAKREEDRIALIESACSGDAHFFAGTDSAPHTTDNKYCEHGCAGIFNAPCALETYIEIFEQANALEHLESFTSLNGARFYALDINSQRVNIVKEPWKMPKQIRCGQQTIIPFRAGETILWRIVDINHNDKNTFS